MTASVAEGAAGRWGEKIVVGVFYEPFFRNADAAALQGLADGLRVLAAAEYFVAHDAQGRGRGDRPHLFAGGKELLDEPYPQDGTARACYSYDIHFVFKFYLR